MRPVRLFASWALGSFVLAVLLSAALPHAIGAHSMVVRSASMTPAIRTGDVVVVRPIAPTEAEVGDIVTFQDPGGTDRLLVHRVRAISREGREVSVITQGDANTTREHWNVEADGTIGTVAYRVPVARLRGELDQRARRAPARPRWRWPSPARPAAFEQMSAVTAGVKDVRETIERARQRLGEHGQGTILFLDEIHRFNKAQQDALLPAVEDGTLTLIGATTENPFFEVNPPLRSRSTLFRLEPLDDDAVRTLVATWSRGAEDDRSDGGDRPARRPAGGDGRQVLTSLEVAVALAVAERRRRRTRRGRARHVRRCATGATTTTT